MDARITTLILEHEEALLHDKAAEVEEILNLQRDDAELPAGIFDMPTEAFGEICRLERTRAEALMREQEDNKAARDNIKTQLDMIREAIDDIPGVTDEGLTAKQTKDMRGVIDEGIRSLRECADNTNKLADDIKKLLTEYIAEAKQAPEEEQKLATAEALAETHKLVEGIRASFSNATKGLASIDTLIKEFATAIMEATKSSEQKTDRIVVPLGKDGPIGTSIGRVVTSAAGALTGIEDISGSMDIAAKKITAVEAPARDILDETAASFACMAASAYDTQQEVSRGRAIFEAFQIKAEQSLGKTGTADELSKIAAKIAVAQKEIEGRMAGLTMMAATIKETLSAITTADDLSIARSSLADSMSGLATAEKLGELDQLIDQQTTEEAEEIDADIRAIMSQWNYSI